MLAASAAGTSGETSRDTLREAKKSAALSGKGKPGALRKSYALDFLPEDGRYRISLVFLGKGPRRGRDPPGHPRLIARIEAGDIDLERDGRFLKPTKPAQPRK